MSLYLSQYALPLFIALLGLENKSLTISGAISAILAAYLIMIRQDIYWFLILFSFYVIGTVATKWKEKEKRKHKLMQKTRGSWNVIGNGAIALIMVLLGGIYGLIGFVGAIATATADTISSEIGTQSKSKPRMITTLEEVEPGTDGAITPLGTAAGIVSAMVIGLISLSVAGWYIVPIALLSGTLGFFADSFIGALWEDKKIVGNSMTNFLATTVGAISALLLSLVFI